MLIVIGWLVAIVVMVFGAVIAMIGMLFDRKRDRLEKQLALMTPVGIALMMGSALWMYLHIIF